MKYIYKSIVYLLLLLFSSNTILAQDMLRSIDWSLVLGFNIGATAPMPIPEEVRAINSYSAKFNPHIGVNGIYKFNEKWGVGTQLALDVKGMRVKDEVKYMHINFVPVGGDSKTDRLEGYFVGKNTTNISVSYLTLSVYANYQLADNWQLRLGGYAASSLRSKFTGSVSDGYLRVKDPTGTKEIINYDEFDFSKDIRDFDLGVLAGAEYRLTNRIGIVGNVTWSIPSIFYSDFNPIQFKLRHIYGTFGVSYRL